MKLQSPSNTEAIKAAEILMNYIISENCSNLSLISEIAQLRDQAFNDIIIFKTKLAERSQVEEQNIKMMQRLEKVETKERISELKKNESPSNCRCLVYSNCSII